jgi:hypothetical protein
MKYELLSIVGMTEPRLKEYRANPGSINAAAAAAAHCAKRNKAPMLVIEGNSYMKRVYHIARETDALAKFLPGVSGPVPALFVNASGCVYRCTVGA